MRTSLKLLRVKHNLTQEEMAEKLNMSRASYSAIELGQRSGKKKFWNSVQENFNVPNEQMWELMLVE